MKLKLALSASTLLLLAVPAAAQVYPGEEVTVNPAAIGHGYLLYPGGKYGRHVGNLLQPGDRPGAIRLHMPVHHAHVPRAPRVARAAPATTIDTLSPTIDNLSPPADAGTPPPPPPRHTKTHAPPPARVAAAAPPPSADLNAVPEDSAARLFAPSAGVAPLSAPPPKPPPAKPRHTAAAPPPAGAAAIPFTFGGPAAAPPPRRTASATPPPANMTAPAGVAAGLRKQSVIPFAPGASSPATADVNAIHSLATTLNAALNAGAAHVQLEAYGGPRGDKSSDSRRLSLKRALVVRELLIEDGVPSEKIDVRAMGGADDDGQADRVDVFVRA